MTTDPLPYLLYLLHLLYLLLLQGAMDPEKPVCMHYCQRCWSAEFIPNYAADSTTKCRQLASSILAGDTAERKKVLKWFEDIDLLYSFHLLHLLYLLIRLNVFTYSTCSICATCIACSTYLFSNCKTQGAHVNPAGSGGASVLGMLNYGIVDCFENFND